MDRRKQKKGRTDNRSAQQTPRRHFVMEEQQVPQVEEPMPPCAICGKPVELISEAISEPNGGYSHFDCVISRIKEQEMVTEDETVSYIGHGNFAVFRKDEEGRYVIRTRVPYESKENYDAMKKFVEGSKK